MSSDLDLAKYMYSVILDSGRIDGAPGETVQYVVQCATITYAGTLMLSDLDEDGYQRQPVAMYAGGTWAAVHRSDVPA